MEWVVIAGLVAFAALVVSRSGYVPAASIDVPDVPMTPQGVPDTFMPSTGFKLSDLFSADGLPLPLYDARTGAYTGPGGPNATLEQQQAAVLAQNAMIVN